MPLGKSAGVKVFASSLRLLVNPHNPLDKHPEFKQLGGVLVEGHASERWIQGLRELGHRVSVGQSFGQEFGEAQLIIREPDHLAAASDPRGLCWGLSTL